MDTKDKKDKIEDMIRILIHEYSQLANYIHDEIKLVNNILIRENPSSAYEELKRLAKSIESIVMDIKKKYELNQD